MRVVFFDLETGGLDGTVYPITQIGAVVTDENLNEIESYERKVLFREKNADPVALKKNHYDRKVWQAEGRDPREVVLEFTALLDKYRDIKNVSAKGRQYTSTQLAGHNAAVFDRKFLGDWYKRLGAYCPGDWRVLDTLQLALWWYRVTGRPRPENFRLETLCEDLGIPMEGAAHDALVDVRATVALAKRLTQKGEVE